MEQISLQIEQTLLRLRLARPTPALWRGAAAMSLESSLARIESELIYLRNMLF